MKRIKNMWFLALLIFISNCSNDPVNPDINVDEAINQEMERLNIPAVVACVVREDEIVWQGIYGYSDASRTIPLTEESLFAIQSISKLFLSTSVMQLWEKGMIVLDEDINQYLPFDVRNPRFPELKITPYMLLIHTSGLAWPADDDGIPDFHHFYRLDEMPLISEWIPEYILPGGTSYRETVWKEFVPGSQWLYSNIGTSLLALIIENITGQDYRDYCREQILEPLEMNNSSFRFSELNQELLVTPFYDNGHPMHQFNLRHYPVANLKTNIQDFSHFISAFINGGEYKGNRILESATVEKMFEIQISNEISKTDIYRTFFTHWI